LQIFKTVCDTNTIILSATIRPIFVKLFAGVYYNLTGVSRSDDNQGIENLGSCVVQNDQIGDPDCFTDKYDGAICLSTGIDNLRVADNNR